MTILMRVSRPTLEARYYDTIPSDYESSRRGTETFKFFVATMSDSKAPTEAVGVKICDACPKDMNSFQQLTSHIIPKSVSCVISTIVAIPTDARYNPEHRIHRDEVRFCHVLQEQLQYVGAFARNSHSCILRTCLLQWTTGQALIGAELPTGRRV